jgi:hypothetical protein
MLQKQKNAKISVEKGSSSRASAAHRYDNAGLGSFGEDVRGSRYSGQQKQGNRSSGENIDGYAGVGGGAVGGGGGSGGGGGDWDMQMDPMTSTLMTSQMLFRKQLTNLRERIQYTNLLHDFDSKANAHLRQGMK